MTAAPTTPAAAFGRPGIQPTWAPGAKLGVGTALSADSPLWFTIAQGVLTELYYPRVDVPNTRDLQYLVLLPGGEVIEERRQTDATVDLLDPRALAYSVTTADRGGRFRIEKRVIADPERPAVAVRTRWQPGTAAGVEGARLFALLAPHVGGHGQHNSARMVTREGRRLIVAWRHDVWLALAASAPLLQASCGFAGASDGWTDLHRNGDMRWRFPEALDGSIAVMAELGGLEAGPFTLAVGFGGSEEEACANAIATADAPWAELEAAYVRIWHDYCATLADLSPLSGDRGRLYWVSAMTLKAHEDQANPGAHIASLAVPWGEATHDDNAGGYHLVWPRDLYHVATGRLAAGDGAGAVAALRYLYRTQRADGSWPQNFWVYGEPYWRGLQLDELAFPILLAWQCRRAGALDFNPYPSLVAPAAYAVARIGPVTPQERWEENGGYSPSTLASAIASLVCAAEMARADGDGLGAEYFLDVADAWAGHIEEWTYTLDGDAAPGAHEYYERIAAAGDAGGVRRAPTLIANVPGHPAFSPASIIDGGFLELVRYGVRAPDDHHIRASIGVYDQACKVATPAGPCWHRYNHDGYGQKADGAPYDGTGIGRAWPLLTGERAHYELAAGGDAQSLARALEAFANAGRMLPEQVWDSGDIPAAGMFLGRPTGSAAPLCWAHAEYVKLLRSLRDGTVFDCPPPVRARYADGEGHRRLAIWKFNNKVRAIAPGAELCIEVYGPAALHWSADGWRTVHHEPMRPRGHGVWTRNWPAGSLAPGSGVVFTFYWHEDRRWEGRDFRVGVADGAGV